MMPRNIKLGKCLIFVFLLGALFFLQACNKQQKQTINIIKTFPLKAGNSWQYEIFTTANKCVGYMDWELSYYATKDPKFKQSYKLNIVYKNEQKITTDLQVIILKNDEGNVNYYAPQQISTNFQLFLAPYPLRAGKTWELNNRLEKYQVLSLENIHTPAGTFLCAKIRYGSNIGRAPEASVYYLGETGLIKLVTRDKSYILYNYRLKSSHN
ncbi:MAG: hypothetical protein PHV30_07645 [Candidatus Margulisbacteria bacterium]|nr:hypothetical protein [Candidatus Margulisiibacteriota bacterium]